MNTKRLSVNISPLERLARMAVGVAAVIAGALLLRNADTGLVVVLEILLALAGLDLVVTGATGHCPLYQKLGHVPAALKGRMP